MGWALATAAGVGLAFALPPFQLGFLAPVPLAVLLRAGGFREGFFAGLGFWALHLVWLPQSFAQLFGTPLGAVPFVPLIVLKALSWGVLFGLTRGRPVARLGGWVVLEYLTSLGPLAFPWGFVGYALVEAPGRVLAGLGGVYLLSLVVLGFAVALGRQRYWLLAGWALLWVLPLPPADPDRYALIVQGAVPPLDKLRGTASEGRYLELTRQGLAKYPRTDLVVWPETAVRQIPPEAEAVLGGRELVSGIPAWDEGYRNRVVLVKDGVAVASYDKSRLVPFGEFFPWRGVLGGVYGFFFQALGLGNLTDTRPGDAGRPAVDYGAYICYESVFPEVARAQARGGARLLVNVSNDAWFGPSFGALQHFQMGRLRAVETGRWLLRAGNDGVSASIDPSGRVVASIPRSQPGFLQAPYRQQDYATPYSRFGDWAVAVAALLFLAGSRRTTLTFRKSPGSFTQA
ncbi:MULTISPECIES: apolipoprotein N-acyltransferase [Thermaceae]|jgi:apolipoprotein N-acyltransferase|uniref:Apolipoprotein N-acyltransferase n=4 Tax=Meiothermus TaxID=65551 RepID=A0A399E4W3_9DEIN|nr:MULTISPECIES: apolipoprotein N-acyltransferase [Thermaceae]AWR88165.1 apolipoprotein N-acyltransferase [Meiothermus taiwanensis WR-220]KIQ53446.1 acyltransferase [Meiothermus taiwanensis]KZK15330.1 apolipoprotein N-acyltransferase [Meiothermus taiwanensis]RIH77271.1 Apolipoprotein N-acyltransferase [Meiothermus taiwanensis]RIH80373.1 Apolipoprotein N-acyltransferase [Meiothermus hypogaeus]